MTQDLTKGNPTKLILIFVLPLILANVFQQLHGLVDAFIIGNNLGVGPLAAVGSTGGIVFLIFGFGMGASNGLGIVTAQKFGSGNMKALRRSVATSIVVGTAIALALTSISVPFARLFLELQRTPVEIIDEAYTFLIILMSGTIIGVFFNLIASLIRALGDSKTPLYIMIVAVVTNLVLLYVFVVLLGMGVGAAATASLIGQFISVMLGAIYIRKKLPIIRLTAEDWKITKHDIIEHSRAALPMGASTSVIAVGVIVVQYALNGLGHVAVAAFTAAARIDHVAMMPLNSFGAAMGTYVAQNYGAGRIDRVKEGVLKCTIIAVAFSVVFGAIKFIFGYTFAGFFVSGDVYASEVQHYAQIFLRVNGSMYAILAVLLIVRFSLQGLGKNFAPALSSVLELIMRVFAALVLARSLGFFGICLSNPLAWLGAAIPLVIIYFTTIKKMEKKF